MLAFATVSRSLVLVGCVALGAGCGSKAPAGGTTTSTGTDTGTDTAASDGTTPWPWEAKLTEGASFTLTDEEDNQVTMTVAKVEATGGTRTYTLAWDENNSNGPTHLSVTGAKVQVGDSPMDPPRAKADASYRKDGNFCFAEDFSNPDGCEDICDAEICFSAELGLAEVSMMYGPSLGTYSHQ